MGEQNPSPEKINGFFELVSGVSVYYFIYSAKCI